MATQTQAQAPVVGKQFRLFYLADGSAHLGCSVRQSDGTFKRAENATVLGAQRLLAFFAKITRRDGQLFNGKPVTYAGQPAIEIRSGDTVYVVQRRALEHYDQIKDAAAVSRPLPDNWTAPEREAVDSAINPDELLFGAATHAAATAQAAPAAQPARRRSRTAQQTMA